MSSITRRLPQSNAGRQQAIALAKLKNDTVPPATPVLNPATVARLNDMAANYPTALQGMANAQAALSNNTKAKNPLMNVLKIFVSHFIQVFNLGVARGKYPQADRAYYQLDVESDALPNLDSESNIMLWAQRVVQGDGSRVTAGGLPMANPEVLEVINAQTPAVAAFTDQSTLADALDTQQEAIDTLNVEADKVIKRVWDEVEAFHGEETAESKRANAREWGVVYVTVNATNTLTGLVKTAGGAAVEGAQITLIESGGEAVSNNEGRYTHNTSLTGTVTIRATLGAQQGEAQITIPEDSEGVTFEVADITLV